MLEHRLAVDGLAGSAGGPASLQLLAVTGVGLLLLQGDPGEIGFARAVHEQFGVGLPGPRAAGIGADLALLWMAPRQWLAQLPRARLASAESALAAKLAALPAAAPVAITDLSDSMAVFDVGGALAADALMQGCSIDLRPHSFAAGRVVRTVCAGVPAIIWKRGESDPLRCGVERSLAWHFVAWLTACAEAN
jgi:sarcosine oxidase, subunit gamma